jgi:uncharacterized membrane protein (GlpM family)
MAGVGLVMLGCVFGGLMAIVLHLLGQRTAAIAVGVVALAPVLAGIVLQVTGAGAIRGGPAAPRNSRAGDPAG